MPNTPPNQSIERAALVLQALGSAETGALRASDIGRAVGLGPSTTSRLLTTLERLDYVRRDPSTQEYRIGTAVLLLASQGLNHNPVHRESRAAAQELAHRTGLTANVAVRDRDHAVYLCHFEGALTRKSHTMVGMAQPLHASALGKVLLLDLSQAERVELLGDLEQYTERTLTDHDALTADLCTSAARGWCYEDQELALGRFCVAVPIRNAGGSVVAALSISGGLTVLRDRDLAGIAEDLIEVGDRISVGLGLLGAVRTSAAQTGR
ncbi:IclR family transcriptional regulator [Cellulomonas sp. RIT-PI-Y]|jgi:IclR family transcriptional regulator, acetate operon repressor|uniref:IclR family transcriptional regulator n=1 Tax=Cellulomonas sp. RIT-PI-Y TaxID=3035297 RepID=UPI0021DA2ECC|nr:IclR family transcriptional regulator [Cellulomonas sp. RIT-PI-Y]